MQDGIHGVLKLRTRFLRKYAALPLGKKLVSVAHLKKLIHEVPKSEHGLVLSDVSPVDKQNYKSMQKCMNIRTRNALRKYIPDSEGTEFFLKLCDEVTISLMDHDITPHERIEKIFHVVFFLRIWRKYILKSNYTVGENFITPNAHLCVEINARNLLKLIRIFREEKKPELFLTTLFDSQACERAFRQLRSMGTANFTKINFNLYELLHMIRRLEVQNDLLYSKLSGTNIKLPKLEKKRETTTSYVLPTEDEIAKCLERAKRFAMDDALQFGIEISPDEIECCDTSLAKRMKKLNSNGNKNNDQSDDDYEDNDDDDDDDRIDDEFNDEDEAGYEHDEYEMDESEESEYEDSDYNVDESEYSECEDEFDNGNADCTDETNDAVEIEDIDYLNGEPDVNDDILEEVEEDNQRAFVEVTDRFGKKYTIRKSTFVWLLSEGNKKISSDRLLRVQQGTTMKTALSSAPNVSCEQPCKLLASNLVHVATLIGIGDWCFFKTDQMVCIGLIHAFRFANKRLVKKKTYRFDTVNLKDNRDLAKKLEVLITWYSVDDKAILIPAKIENHSFISLDKYIATLTISPAVDPDTRVLFFIPEDFKKIESDVLKLIE